MNDIRRTILWVIFGFSMVLLWDQWQIHNGHKPTFFPKTEPAAVASAPAASAAVPTASAVVTGPGQVPATQSPAAVRELIDVETDLYRLRFDTEGGSLVHAELRRHPDLLDPKKNFVLFDESRDRVYVAQTGLIGG